MELKVITIVLLLKYLSLTNAQESCTTPARQQGSCIVLRNCASIFNLISTGVLTDDQKTNIRSSWCGIENGQHKICCPSNVRPIQPPTQPQTRPPTQPPTRQPLVTSSTNLAQVSDLSNHRNINLLPSTICGNIVDDKISRGNKTEPFEYPWMAIIQYQTMEGVQQLCGGSIFNKRYVLTAAHCIAFLRAGMTVVSVVLGEHNTRTNIDCASDGYCGSPAITVPVEEIIPFPGYNRRAFLNDIGLIRLNRDVDFTPESIRPICLPTSIGVLNTVLAKIKVTGWGRTENKTVSESLLQAVVDVVPNNVCQRSYEPRVTITATHMCAGGGGIDSCQGDSGGPAIFPSSTRFGPRYVQFGVVSAGQNNCGAEVDVPGLYTRVGPYMSWILDTIH